MRSNITRRKANITEAHFLTECASREAFFYKTNDTLHKYRENVTVGCIL